MHIGVIFALALASDDYMKMLQPPQETPQDKEVLAIIQKVNAAHQQKNVDAEREFTAQLRAYPNAQKSLNVLMKSREKITRALAVYGFRLLPVKNGFKDKLQYLMMDGEPMVRELVLMYVAAEPGGVTLQHIQLALTDGSPPVRAAAVPAIVRVAKKPEEAAALFKQRLQQEDDPNVLKAIRLGYTMLGMSMPEVTKK